MAATITTLQTRPDRLRRDQAAELRRLVIDLPGLPEPVVGQIIAVIDQQTVSATGWTFVMISPTQHSAVVAWLEINSRRPVKALRIWAELFTVLRVDTGQIMWKRSDLAERVGIEPRDVSRIMGELRRCGAVSRHSDDTGRPAYFLNPRVGTHLAGVRRDRAQAEAPLLTLMTGGKV